MRKLVLSTNFCHMQPCVDVEPPLFEALRADYIYVKSGLSSLLLLFESKSLNRSLSTPLLKLLEKGLFSHCSDQHLIFLSPLLFSTDENLSSLSLSYKLPGHLKINWAHFNLIPNAQRPGELFSAPFVAVCNYHGPFKEKKSNRDVFYVNYQRSSEQLIFKVSNGGNERQNG